MKSRFTAAAVAAALVGGGVLAAGTVSASAAAGAPWEPDSQAVGSITFYDSSGAVITSGSTNSAPFFAYAVGSSTVRAGDEHAGIYMATPKPEGNSDSWFRDQLTGFTDYPLSSGPSNIKTLSQTRPVESGKQVDQTIEDYTAEAPNDSGSVSDSSYVNKYQVRLVTSNSDGTQTLTYDAADIQVDTDNHTWKQISASPDKTTLSAGKSTTIADGKSVTLKTTLTDKTTSKSLAGAKVQLFSKTGSKAFTGGKTVKTSSSGSASVSVKPSKNTVYQWRFAGDATHASSTSASQTVHVSDVVTISAKPSSVNRGSKVSLFGTVKPGSSGEKVSVQKKSGSSWSTVGSAKLKRQKLPNGKTAVGYVVKLTESKKGTITYRAHSAGTSSNVAGSSSSINVKVK